MSCIHPILVKGVYVPCGKCPECRQKYRKELSSRILIEKTIDKSGCYFITLSYDSDHLPGTLDKPAFSKAHCRQFIDNLRYRFEKNDLGNFRYFLTCELGEEFGRSHYHLIILCNKINEHTYPVKVLRTLVDDAWQKGRTNVSIATEGRINYATQYALKEESYLYKTYDRGDPSKPFRLFSLKPGLGATPTTLSFLADYIINDGTNYRWSLPLGNGTVPISRYQIKKLCFPYDELYAQKSQQWLDDHQEEMEKTKLNNQLQVHSKFGSTMLINDYHKDNEIISKRKLCRLIRKSYLDNLKY